MPHFNCCNQTIGIYCPACMMEVKDVDTQCLRRTCFLYPASSHRLCMVAHAGHCMHHCKALLKLCSNRSPGCNHHMSGSS